MQAVTSISLGRLAPAATGKVREMFDLGDSMLMVATDRLSAFDVVLPTGIPCKGHVLTQLSAFWFDLLNTPHHMVSVDFERIAAVVRAAGGDPRPELSGRSMLVRKAKPVKLECVVRGYISGSLWKEYRQAGGPDRTVELHGISLPAGLQESQRLEEPIFTPATKADTGHDENIGMKEAAEIVGADLLEELRRRSLSLYMQASDHAARAGLILADTKFEFGTCDSELILIDEVLTPDSSRYWEAGVYRPGSSPPSFDKQYVRDYLEGLNWDKTPPGPELPEHVVQETTKKYVEAFRRLTGRELAEVNG
ncbi:MAG: phosphoribosylaminoimidazolesuccinocarboxamide synthase [Fimbriimonadia bacterium]|jgi:phosphoribosylaminoimidazole-succinocarboxamide synthase